MKIKIGNKIIDPEKEPVMLIFDDIQDRQNHLTNIMCMTDELKYCIFNDKHNLDEIKQFMKI
jgi:hypothetical protein